MEVKEEIENYGGINLMDNIELSEIIDEMEPIEFRINKAHK